MLKPLVLNEICTDIIDCPHSTPKWTSSGIIVIRNQNIRNGRLDLSDTSYTDIHHYSLRIKRGKPEFNDIVITREAPMGEVCQIPENLKCCLGQRMVLLKPNNTIISPKYLLYALQSPIVQHEIKISEGTGSTVSNLRIPLLENLKIPVFSLPIQNAIAHILGTLDDKIELNRRMNETLESIARTIFTSWFIDFDPVRAKAEGRQPEGMDADTAALFPNQFEEVEGQEIPKGWNRVPFYDVIDIIGGGTPKTSIDEYWNGEIPWFSVVDSPLLSDIWVIQTEKKITDKGLNNSSTRLLSVGTTIITARGTVGNVALVGVPMTMNQSCYGLKIKSELGDFFSYYQIRSIIEELKQHTHGSVFDTVTRNTFSQFSLTIPSNEILSIYEKIVTPILENIKQNLMESNVLTEIRDILLPKLLSGELQIDNPEVFLEGST